uniref:NAD(P)-binding domain-containing protein n=1 Tax=Rhodosorus marinus TaxID=101924 RepID=A0A7S2ZP11_9RHOD
MEAFVQSVNGFGGGVAAKPSSCSRRAPLRMARVREDVEDKNPLDRVGDFVGAFQRLLGVGRQVDDSLLYLGEEGSEPLFEEQPPVVLVVGATGEVGRVIVRKLLLRGYQVRVLVRNLFTETLDLLGTGCSYVMGDITDPYALMEAVSGVDKVVCSVKARSESEVREVELDGLKKLVRAFHDVRHADYGRTEATKVTLFKFNREKDFRRWRSPGGSEEDDELVRKPARVDFRMNVRNNAVFTGQVFDTYTGHAELICDLKKLNMRGFSGLVVRCLGDGKQYRMVFRTGPGDKNGVIYEAEFATVSGKWSTIRLPLVSFKPRSLSGSSVPRELEELDRSDVRQIKIEYRKPLSNPERDPGFFSLTLDYMKAYRTQNEADFVLVSCSKVTEAVNHRKQGREEDIGEDTAMKYMGEESLRNSGISYCIVRSGQFTDQTGGRKALVLEQNTELGDKHISKSDLAEVCVSALQDPRARNVTFDAYEAQYAPTALSPSKDIGSMLEGLKPNS